VLFTFPSRYWSTIGHQGVFRLRRWSSQIHTDFHGLRATREHARESHRFRIRGYHPLCRRFPAPSATHAISHSLPDQQLRPGGPATPATQRLLALTRDRFSLFPFRSPLLRESRLLSLPAGTEMFHFPALPPLALCVQARVTSNYARSGFPIRKSPDQRLVADSPGLIAGSNVLHRLLVPRHPPCALSNLATLQISKMLASTVQFSRNGRHHPPPRHPAGQGSGPVTKKQARPVPSGPNSVPTQPPPREPPFRTPERVRTSPARDRQAKVISQCSTSERHEKVRGTLARARAGSLERR
jgi:hypothetical protein